MPRCAVCPRTRGEPWAGGSDKKISALVGLVVVIVAAAVIALIFFLQTEEGDRPEELATLVDTPTIELAPEPATRLVLSDQPTVVGYWLDGTADVQITGTLLNKGTSPVDRDQLPMGTAYIELHYGIDRSPTLQVDVPERILGVDRGLWECCVDRPVAGSSLGSHDEWTAGCGGWGDPGVIGGANGGRLRQRRPFRFGRRRFFERNGQREHSVALVFGR